MPLPGQKVELAFGDSGYFDVTQYVQSVSINRGINRVLDDFSAGSCSVTFVNNERIFDPTNGFPNLIANYNFETNLDGWIALLPGSMYRGTAFYMQSGTTLPPYAGTGFLTSVSGGSVPIGSDYVIVANPSSFATIKEGTTYTISAQNVTYWNTQVRVAIGWFNESGEFISQSSGSFQPSSNTNWKEITHTAVAPVGAVKAEAVLYTVNLGGGFEESAWDYVTIREYSATQSPLFDLIKPAGNIRVSSNSIRRFTGFVQDWDFSFGESGFDGQATVTAFDFMYKVANTNFTGGTQYEVEATSDRIKSVMKANGFGTATYADVYGGHTLVGYDVNNPGDNVLSYLQNVARSEPADFFSSASAVMELKDRSFTNYVWTNTNRYNFVTYPSTATILDNFTGFTEGENLSGWTLIGTQATATTSAYGGFVWRGGTVVDPFVPTDSFVGFVYQDYNPTRYVNAGGTYTFAGLIRGVAGNFDISLFTLDAQGQVDGTAASTVVSSPSSTAWNAFTVTKVASATATVGGVAAYASISGGTTFIVTGDGFIIEPAGTSVNYFDGDWNPYAGMTSASTAYEIAWAGVPRASQSGLLTSVAGTVTAPAVRSFADANSQSLYSGTAIPFTDLQVVYASEQLYNKVQVVGVNATAVTEDTTIQGLYGLRVYSQTDNLTTSTTKPGEIASAFLGEFRLPEYRAEQMTIALEALTTAQQNIVLGIEIRDVVRVAFKPSNTGSIVEKYYQVLGVDANADVERDAMTFKLASLDNLPFRLDSPFLGVLDTDTLA